MQMKTPISQIKAIRMQSHSILMDFFQSEIFFPLKNAKQFYFLRFCSSSYQRRGSRDREVPNAN